MIKFLLALGFKAEKKNLYTRAEWAAEFKAADMGWHFSNKTQKWLVPDLDGAGRREIYETLKNEGININATFNE